MTKYAMLFRKDLCLGCQACEIACKQEHDIPVGPRWTRIITLGPEEKAGKIRLSFEQTRCMHCGHPPCIAACPVDAISKREDGIVLINEELCIGCSACIEACPFGAPQYNPRKDKVEKCNLCAHRIDRGIEPACVHTCPTGALVFGEKNEVTEIIRVKKAKSKYLRTEMPSPTV